jgi:hypothetical protein
MDGENDEEVVQSWIIDKLSAVYYDILSSILYYNNYFKKNLAIVKRIAMF